jgi:hypothetical protein
MQRTAAAATGSAQMVRELTHMVSPTAKVDMVVPAKARAHTEPMFLTNLQQFNGQTVQHAPVSVCKAACTQRSLAGKYVPLFDLAMQAACFPCCSLLCALAQNTAAHCPAVPAATADLR